MSDDAFEIDHDPSKETQFSCEREKETHSGSAHRRPSPWKIGDRLGDFSLEKMLGSGSSGFVYRAVDVQTQRHCALKLLTQGAPGDLLRNKLGFRRMMAIEHPNLLRVDRIYQLGSTIALSMEEIEGTTLKAALNSFKAMDPSDACERLLSLLRDYASGLALMHAKGYTHRDIKPDNLMIDLNGRGRVIDYGLVDAYQLDQEVVGARGLLVGTPHYFAPEVIWSQRYLPAGDIFSLGIVMLDALRTIDSDQGKLAAALKRSKENQQDDAERIDEAIEDLPESIPSVILEACREMLERLPADRPTAMELSRLGIPRPLPTPFFGEGAIVGRDAELTEIDAWVEDIFAGKIGRLHLRGPEGMGKSRLVNQAIRSIESKHWGQVFQARCRVREDQPYQAFDQICDAITHRYMKGDRERLELDSASAALLEGVFPALTSVISSGPPSTSSNADDEPIDTVEAVARLSDQLRLVGPLFLVVDDAQWADRDSLNVLDRLQIAGGKEGLGIITTSSEDVDPQRIPPDHCLSLEPLKSEHSIEILAHTAASWNVNVSPSMLQDLAEASGGSPFRLRELADEFRPGGALSQISEVKDDEKSLLLLGNLDQLWKRRSERLSTEAKQVLTYVCTAEESVSTEQLGELTGLGDAVDAAVSELARQRLVIDGATGGECIVVFHDHVTDELVRTLAEQEIRQAHEAWAVLLSRRERPDLLASRIAGHFIAADEPGRALAHAFLAAEDAERRGAFAEAGRWYSRIIDNVEGEERIQALRKAARCYDQAGFGFDAATCYQKLAPLVDQNERRQCEFMAVTLTIRSGRLNQVKDQLQQLTVSLGLPKMKSPWQSKCMLRMRQVLLRIRGKNLMSGVLPEATANAGNQDSKVPKPINKPAVMQEHRATAIDFCGALVRPLSVLYPPFAAELSFAGSRLCEKHGDASQKSRFAITESVFQCLDRGHQRIDGETNLLILKPKVDELRCDFTSGEFWSGLAFSHALACRWDQVLQPLQISIHHYQSSGKSCEFEIAYAQWLSLWAGWNLGRWSMLRSRADRMLDQSKRLNAPYLQMMSCGGLAAAGLLASDGVESLQTLHPLGSDDRREPCHPDLAHTLSMMATVQIKLYLGEYLQAWVTCDQLERTLRSSPFWGIQMFRVTSAVLGGIAALHLCAEDSCERWQRQVQKKIGQLAGEQLGYSKMLSDFYHGLLHLVFARQKQNYSSFQQAEKFLDAAHREALARHLRPYQLAAEDKIAEIQTGQSLGCLQNRMKGQHIAKPTFLQRLYTLPDR